ncbi:MAG TPA: serine hydrolase [Segeticoccus sp.]|uniref:serine hydrolase n=1 Tax=Segeticoccus sp. TaxID=2706531 RepID=UPI002D7E3470|nr:serine hydrolase [Segeticoccus sp.]HET8599235.1 serine hydrolase [Segeticoccus sp.]
MPAQTIEDPGLLAPLTTVEGVRWSAQVRDAATGEVLDALTPATVLTTASVGKLFLLLEVAEQLADGRLDPDLVLDVSDDDLIADSGLLQHFRNQSQRVADLALLVGAVSDNLATNVLLRHVGLEATTAQAERRGFADTRLLDQVRDDRPADDPLTLSRGRGDELCALVSEIHQRAEAADPVAAQVRRWLGTDTDLSMVAAAFGLDPLAHVDPDEGLALFNKTGTERGVRIDVGAASGPAGALAYAVLGNWDAAAQPELRGPVLAAMRQVGGRLLARIWAS